MAEQNPHNLEANVLRKTDQLLEEIYQSYTKISLYEKIVGKRDQMLRLPISDPDFWKLCEKSYAKLLEQTRSLNLEKTNGDIDFDLTAIQNFILLSDIDKNFKRYMVPCQEKILFVKKEIPKIIQEYHT